MEYLNFDVENWGPFLGKHSLDLSKDGNRNVVIIYGENGTGKSHLFRALQFALYGNVREDGEDLAPSSLVNEIAATGTSTVSSRVSLQIRDEEIFAISRHLEAESSDGLIRINKESSSLISDNRAPLSGDVMRDYIEKRFPNAVSKFFLFDAEIIRRFEHELSGGDSGSLMRRNIHDILGVPAFANVTKALDRIEASATKKLASMKSASKKVNEQYKQMAELREKIDVIQAEIDELDSEQLKLDKEIKDLDASLAKYVDQERALGQLEQAEQTLADRRDKREDLSQQLTLLTRDAWFAPLINNVSSIVQGLSDERDRVIDAGIEALLPVALDRLRQRSGEQGQCQLCGEAWELHDEHRESDLAPNPETFDADLFRLKQEIAGFQFLMKSASQGGRIKDVESDISDVDLEIVALGNQIDSYLVEIGDRGDDISLLQAQKDQKQSARTRVTSTLNRAQEVKTDLESETRSIRQKVGEVPESGLEQKREEVAESLVEVFESALKTFEKQMKNRVQDSASNVFSRLISSQELVGLRIDDQFRVTVLDSSGKEAPRLSQGQQQVRAIALLSGLFECGVRNAPLVMDTPFARLDRTHISNILEWIKGLDRQVVLLVQSNEFQIDTHRPLLNDVIAREYVLDPLRLKETQIRPGRPDL